MPCKACFQERSMFSEANDGKLTGWVDYKVCCDCGDVGTAGINPAAVLLADGLPQRGSTYNPSGTCPLPGMVAVSRSTTEEGSERDKDGRCCAVVRVNYETVSVGEPTSGDETPPYDPCVPETWCPEWEDPDIIIDERISTRNIFLGAYKSNLDCRGTGACEDVKPRFDMENDCRNVLVGDCGVIPVNSVGDRLDISGSGLKELTWKARYCVATFTRCLTTASMEMVNLIGAINCHSLRMRIPCRCVDLCFAPRTLRIVSVVPNYREFECEGGQYVRWQICFEHNPCGFWDDLMNQGRRRCKLVCPGQHEVQPITDPSTNQPVTDPVNLDLNGEPTRDIWALRYGPACDSGFKDIADFIPGMIVTEEDVPYECWSPYDANTPSTLQSVSGTPAGCGVNVPLDRDTCPNP